MVGQQAGRAAPEPELAAEPVREQVPVPARVRVRVRVRRTRRRLLRRR